MFFEPFFSFKWYVSYSQYNLFSVEFKEHEIGMSELLSLFILNLFEFNKHFVFLNINFPVFELEL